MKQEVGNRSFLQFLINWVPVHKRTFYRDCVPGEELWEEAARLVLMLDAAYTVNTYDNHSS